LLRGRPIFLGRRCSGASRGVDHDDRKFFNFLDPVTGFSQFG
jgi:hypothetical protein